MKKVMLLGMVLVLCLAAVGVGYAHWTKDLYVNGVVNTGTFDAEMSQGVPFDNEYDKEVAEGTCSVVEGGLGVELTVNNAYPCYEVTFPLDVHCIGSVPLHINDISVTSADRFLAVSITDADGGPWQQGYQLHNCEEYWFNVTIHVLQDVEGDLCPEGAALSCSISITVDQFNYPYAA
jgi:hypothetical protein